MADIVDPGTRSRMMARIRGKNTKPEIAVRRFLHRRGFRYLLHPKHLPGKPDIVLPRYKTVVQVHGCFWHQHPGCRLAVMPSSNRSFWETKLHGNRARDVRDEAALRAMGWNVQVVWECDIRDERLSELAERIRANAAGPRKEVVTDMHQSLKAVASIKMLSTVETNADASNQHELHAGLLRRQLGFTEPRTEGSLTFVYYDDSGSPEVDEDGYTLVDVRRNKPGRREWHLYYRSRRFQQVALPGDLLVMLRPDPDSDDLVGIVARKGSVVESQLRNAFTIGPTAILRQFVKSRSATPTLDTAEQLALELVGPVAPDAAAHPLLKRALEEGALPPTAEMAEAAHELVRRAHGPDLDPDDFLVRALEAESDLFFAIERELGQSQLNDLIMAGGRFESVLAFALSKHQSRKVRRGLSLQNHVAALFVAHDIPHSAQCKTERRTPDFIIPSCEAYHDPAFPAEMLRMVGCKSRVRERWQQYIREAERIPTKYHVTVDNDLTDSSVQDMHDEGLSLFVPRSVIECDYAGTRASTQMRTIADLLAELRLSQQRPLDPS